MRKISLFVIILLVSIDSFAQSLGYQDLGILFSQDDRNGTARFKAMGGAFGAIGGDLSSININPAGLAIYSLSSFSASYDSRDTEITANYYGNQNTTKDNYFNISNAGAVFVFESAYATDWTKFALAVNYRIKKDFSNRFFASGNSNIPTFREFPGDTNDPALQYDFSEEQSFNNIINGDITELNLAFAAVQKEKLYLGGSINLYSLNFSQSSLLTEFNNDGNGNTLEADLFQQVNTVSEAFSINVGFIYKLTRNFRVGASYHTPTWHTDVIETTNLKLIDGFFGEVNMFASDGNLSYSNTGRRDNRVDFGYNLRTPSEITTSAAYIFGKSGLISIDYTTKNYQNISLSGVDFAVENQFFQNSLRNAYTLNFGTEWRLGLLSIRGGYTYEQSPYRDALKTDDIKGYSYGLGYNFGNFKIDLAFKDTNNTAVYNFYPQFDNINATELDINNKIFTATVSINL